jgi:hypothetical protein
VGLREALNSNRAVEMEAAVVVILGNFIWLLTEFIGQNLGLRKVHEVWPMVPFTGSDVIREDIL